MAVEQMIVRHALVEETSRIFMQLCANRVLEDEVVVVLARMQTTFADHSRVGVVRTNAGKHQRLFRESRSGRRVARVPVATWRTTTRRRRDETETRRRRRGKTETRRKED